MQREVEATGRRFTAYRCDFGDRADLYRFIERIKAEQPPIDILVNNAGTILRTPAAEHSDDYWDRVMEVNLNAQFILTREIGATMVARGSGKIIFTASLLTFQGGITVPGYAASKGGIGQLTMAFANEWAAKGVNVNAIAPGYIDTDMVAAVPEPVLEKIVAKIPVGRLGQAEEIARGVAFFTSDNGAFMTGSTMSINGGQHMY